MLIELTVILKDEEKTMKQKFLLYDDLNLSLDDSKLLDYIREAKENFTGHPTDIIINAKMVVQ